MGFQWGFDNLKPNTIWNKIYSNHRHPNGDFANTEPHCPCDDYRRLLVDEGTPSLALSTINVKLPSDNNSQVLKIQNSYSMRGITGNQAWDKFALEQAFYLIRKIAKDHRLRAYYRFKNDAKVYSLDMSQNDITVPPSASYALIDRDLDITENKGLSFNQLKYNNIFVVKPKSKIYEPEKQQTVQQTANIFQSKVANNLGFFKSTKMLANRSYYFTPEIEHIIFVWNIDNEDFAVALELPKGLGFGGAHLLLERTRILSRFK